MHNNNKSDVDVCFESNERSSNRQNTDHLVSVESLHNDTNHPCRKILFCHSWREEKFTIIVVQKKTMKRKEREREREAKNDLRSRLNQEITDMKQAATTCREMSPAKMRHFKMSRPRGTETLANFLTN